TVPWIITHGAAEYTKFGTEKTRGTRLLSVSGNVRKPGVYEIEIGVPFTHVIMELAGGPFEGRQIKAFWPGGSSAKVLPASRMDVTTDAEALAAADSMAGSGGWVVQSAMNHFPEEFEEHAVRHTCSVKRERAAASA